MKDGKPVSGWVKEYREMIYAFNREDSKYFGVEKRVQDAIEDFIKQVEREAYERGYNNGFKAVRDFVEKRELKGG